jgi:hypothetical protein
VKSRLRQLDGNAQPAEWLLPAPVAWSAFGKSSTDRENSLVLHPTVRQSDRATTLQEPPPDSSNSVPAPAATTHPERWFRRRVAPRGGERREKPRKGGAGSARERPEQAQHKPLHEESLSFGSCVLVVLAVPPARPTRVRLAGSAGKPRSGLGRGNRPKAASDGPFVESAAGARHDVGDI